MLLGSVAVLALGAPAAPAGAAPATRQQPDDAPGLGLRLLDIPLARVKDPRANAYIVDHVKPGATIQRRVEVRNTSPEPQHVELYAGGAEVRGNTFTGVDGRGGNELSGWVSLGAETVDLAPDDRRRVLVTVAVPKSASKGERYGAVWAQITRPPTDGGNVGQIRRVGIRMYLDIGPGGEPPTDFRIDGLTVETGTGEWPVVTALVHNTGERALDMTGNLTLSSESGTVRAGPFSVVTGVTILPGQNGRVTAPVSQPLPGGVWNAHLSLASGTVERAVDGKVTLPGPAVEASTRSSGTNRLALSLGADAVLVVVLALLARYLVQRGRTRSRRSARDGAGAR